MIDSGTSTVVDKVGNMGASVAVTNSRATNDRHAQSAKIPRKQIKLERKWETEFPWPHTYRRFEFKARASVMGIGIVVSVTCNTAARAWG